MATATTTAVDDKLLSSEDILGLTPIRQVDVGELDNNITTEVVKKKSKRVSKGKIQHKKSKIIFDKEININNRRHLEKEEPPITYNILSTKTRAPSTKLYFRHTRIHQLITPGPGSYFDSSRGASTAQAKGVLRFHKPLKRDMAPYFFRKSEAPGPGAYTLQSDLGKGKSFSMLRRDPTQSVIDFKIPQPGPATYTIPSHVVRTGTTSGMAFTISGRPSSPCVDFVKNYPGPGAYHPLVPATPTRGPSISTGKHINLRDEGPGPGAYNNPQVCKNHNK